MAVGDVLEVVFISRFADQVGLNVRHWVVTAQLGTGGLLSEAAASIRATAEPIYESLLSDQAEFIGVTVQKIFPLPKSIAVGDGAAAVPGTIVGDPLPKQVAGIISFRSEFAGRRERGRVYIPFASEVQNDPPTLPSVAYRANLGTLGAFMAGNIGFGTAPNTSAAQAAIWHRASSTYSLIVAYRVGTRWATQRRRGDLGRPNPPGSEGGFVIT